jgi:hypothetical protein
VDHTLSLHDALPISAKSMAGMFDTWSSTSEAPGF